MSLTRYLSAAVVFLALNAPVQAETSVTRIGGDSFVAGGSVVTTLDSARDAFVAGRSAVARGKAEGDLHVVGFDVSVSADTGNDLYAMGATVVLRGPVTEDLSAAGFSVRTESGAEIAGNARLMGNSVVIEGPVAGTLSVLGNDVVLNAPIAEDAHIIAETLSFGPKAVIGGTITYNTEKPVSVPERVAPPDRVVLDKSLGAGDWAELTDMRGFGDMPMLPAFASMFFGFLISVLFFVALGALMLGFMPRRLDRMRQSIAEAPGRMLLLGVIGLSILFGLVPITALTIIGIPFVPIAILLIVIAWTLGYALGAYTVAMRIWVAFGGDPDQGNIQRLLVFAGAIVAIALLNFIPFVGWVANYTLVLLGTGAITRAVFLRFIGDPGPALDVDMKPTDT